MQNMLATLDAFWQKASLYMNLPKISITDIVEIIIIAFLIYYMLVWIKNTRAWMLLRGLMVILLFVLLAALFQMNTIIWIARNTLNVLVIALVVIFQPEMRKALENLGRKNVLAFLFPLIPQRRIRGSSRIRPLMKWSRRATRWEGGRRSLTCGGG